MLDVIQSLWMGPELSTMERLSISSFLKNGHPYHLYTYGPVGRVPEGTVIKDANEIIDQYMVFLVRGGYSSFSDFFRWELIKKRGGWWADTDAICLRPFDFLSEYIFVGGLGKPGSDDCISSGVFKAPRGSEITQRGCMESWSMDPNTMAWGAAGPPLFTELVHRFNLTSAIVRGTLFFPVFYTEAPMAFIDIYPPRIAEDCYSVHLFNEMWRLAGQDKNGLYPRMSLYEQLKRRFL
jgi:hypothetical protein